MTESSERLRRQAQWQKRRKELSWPDKIRLAEAIRDSLESLRRSTPGASSRRQMRRP